MRVFVRILQFLRIHWMPSASALAALVSMLFVPPDGTYLTYFDWKTLGCLFCVLAVATALRNAGTFDWAARAIIRRFARPQTLVMTLVLTTAIISMLFTNDVALVIMLPLTVAILVKLDRPQLMPTVFSLQALAANLCGMITPFGNPQNIYIFSYYHIGLMDFLATMAPPFVLATAAIIIVTMMMTRGSAANQGSALESAESPVSQPEYFDSAAQQAILDYRRLLVYVPLFIVTLLAVFRLVPTFAAVAIVVLALLVVDRRALIKVDYALLFTFLCFFVFAGNMARIPVLEEAIRPIMDSWGLITAALTSQIISNVPAAVLLSHFTDVWHPLLVGVNIGGAGTFIGSLASLIVIRHFMIARTMVPRLREPDAPSAGTFLRLFGIVNMGFFIGLLLICQAISIALG